MRDVGDRDDQAEAILVRLAPHGIVEILGVLAVDGDQRHGAQVHARADLVGLHLQRHRGGLRQHLRREFVRDVVAVDRRLHRLRGGELVAQHRQHLADRRAMRIRRRGDLGDHQLPVARVVAAVGRDHHVALHALVVRYHVADAGLFGVAADQAGQAALQHLDDRALATPPAIHAGDAGQHAVAVHDLAHLERRQEQVVAATGIRAQETEAVLVGDHHAGHQVHALGRHVTATPVLQQLAVAQHGVEPFLQRLEAIRRGQRQFLRQRIDIHRSIAGGQHLQDHLAAGDRLRIALRLALRMRIEARRGRRIGPRRGRTAMRRRRSRQFRHPRRSFRCRGLAAACGPGFARLARRLAGLARGRLAAATAALAGRLAHAPILQGASWSPACRPGAGNKKPRLRGVLHVSRGAQERTRTSTVLPAST